MFKARLRRVLVKGRRTTMDSRRLDREASELHQKGKPEQNEPVSEVPHFGVRPSRH